VKLLTQLSPWPAELRGGAVAIGNFDGVHRGHARIVESLLASARRCGGPAIVFTFDPHPVRLLRPAQAPPPLTWTDRKAELLGELGVDVMLAYPTDDELLSFTADEFFERIVREQLSARAMVEGPNFFFGADRSGDIQVLGGLCQSAGIELEIVEPLVEDGAIVSSSRTRQAVAAGDVDEARRLLTRPYRIRGMVIHGAGRGTKIGFATANIDAIDTLLPASGVYAGVATYDRSQWPTAINIGPKPTFGESSLSVEAHLIGFSGSLYGQPLEVDFLARLRDIQPFDHVDALRRQLAEDVATALKIADADSSQRSN
jgi:riboflavin kinase/FMN adenylyltransferase